MSDTGNQTLFLFPRGVLFFHANRSAMAIRGLIFFILGLIGLFRPIGTMAAVTIVLGIFLLIDAMGALFLALACRQLFSILWSILLCAAGIVLIVRPVAADVLIMVTLGVWLIVTGASELFSSSKTSQKALLSGSGLFSIVIGILLLIAPLAGVAAATWIVALLLLISGAEMLLLVWGLSPVKMLPGAGGNKR